MLRDEIYNYQKNRIIVFEGINKSGKSYTISLLQEHMEVYDGLEVSLINIKDLYTEEHQEIMQKVLTRKNAGCTFGEVSTILDLHEQLLETALDRIDNGVDYVFVDRFVLSCYVYNIVCNALLTDDEKHRLIQRYEKIAQAYQGYQAKVILFKPRDPNVSKQELDEYNKMIGMGCIPSYDCSNVLVARSGDIASVIGFIAHNP